MIAGGSGNSKQEESTVLAKRQLENEARRGPSSPPPFYRQASGGNGLSLATLGGVVVLLMISFSNWREIDGIEQSLNDRLNRIDNRITEVSSKMDDLPAPAARPAQRGPDPNKVYRINTAGAPALGPASAAVTIAEFSDFQ